MPTQCLKTHLFLQNAAKQAAAAATQTIAAAQHAASSNRNQAAQQQLVQSCKVILLSTLHRLCFQSHFFAYFHIVCMQDQLKLQEVMQVCTVV